jgi:hypothetical protein
MDFVISPHWYRAGRVVALYVGDDAPTLAALSALLGDQIAGA